MLGRYCAETAGGAQARLRGDRHRARDNWECAAQRGFGPGPGSGPGTLIDMDAACRHRYGAEAFARAERSDDAFSWRCLRRD